MPTSVIDFLQSFSHERISNDLASSNPRLTGDWLSEVFKDVGSLSGKEVVGSMAFH